MQTTVSVSCPVCISNLLGCSWLPIMSHVVGFKVEVSPIMVVVIITDPLFTSELCTFLDWWNWIASFPGHLPGHLPLHFLECICDLWTIWRSWRRPSTTPTSSNYKVDFIMTYVDLVSVIMAICPHMFNIASSCEYYWVVQKRQWLPSESLLVFTILWWTTWGVRYGSPCCTVVVGSYSG